MRDKHINDLGTLGTCIGKEKNFFRYMRMLLFGE